MVQSLFPSILTAAWLSAAQSLLRIRKKLIASHLISSLVTLFLLVLSLRLPIYDLSRSAVMKRMNLFVVMFSAVALINSCKDDEPIQPHIATIQLTVEDASCTEAWLKASLTDANEPRTIAILQDGQRVTVSRLPSPDSVFVVEGLLPRHTYSFVAQRLRDSMAIDASSSVQATTMDTTSHNITWEVDTLGDASSMLSDIAIVNDTLAYAVGEMYLRDSTGLIDPQAYNVARWNGASWTIMRIQFYTICGGSGTTPYPTSSVLAFSATDVWIAMDGDQIARWNGTLQTTTMCLPVSFSIRKLWGGSPSSIYAVGDGGNIMHYNGMSWQRVETGTTLDVRDIWGANDRNGQLQILALASTYTAKTQESRILKIEGNSAAPVSTAGLATDMASIWFVPGMKYYAVGAGIHRKRMLSDSAWIVYPHGVVTSFGSWGVRGTGVNNVFVAGSFGEIVHFNGVNWHRYFGGVSLPGGALGPMAVTDRLVMVVGHIGASRGIVFIGRR